MTNEELAVEFGWTHRSERTYQENVCIDQWERGDEVQPECPNFKGSMDVMLSELERRDLDYTLRRRRFGVILPTAEVWEAMDKPSYHGHAEDLVEALANALKLYLEERQYAKSK